MNLLESREQRYIKKQSRRNKIHPQGYKFYSILFCFLHGWSQSFPAVILISAEQIQEILASRCARWNVALFMLPRLTS